MKNKYFHQFLPALLICTFTVLLSTNAKAQSQQYLLALSKGNHTLAIVDASTLKVLAHVPVGQDPHEVIASTDGKTAYVSIYGGGSLYELNVIDLVNQKPLNNVDTRPLYGPHGLVYVNNKVWFSAEGSKAVGCYNPEEDKPDWSMGTGQDRTHMIYVSADAKKIYTTNVSSGTVSILIDTPMTFAPPKNAMPPGNKPPPPGNMPGGQQRANWEQTLITVSRGCEGFDVTPDGNELWTASSEDGNIYVVDLKSKKLSQKIAANVTGANRLKFSPDGKLAFIASLRSPNITVYDVATRKEKKLIKVGSGAAGIVMEPGGQRAFIACTPDNYVAVIDLKTLEVTDHIDVGKEPDGLAWSIMK